MSNRVFFTLVGGVSALLLTIGVFIAVRDKQATDAESDRRTHEFTCAIQADEGLPQDEDC
jgi:hypothetical protein